LKKHEIESLVKSFLLFFISLGIFLAFILYLDYKQKIEDLKQDIFAQMRVCSFNLECPDFKIDFKDKDIGKPLFLYEIDGTLEAYFLVPTSNKYLLSITYPVKSYENKRSKILKENIFRFLLYLIIVAVLSVLFSFYALYPMKEALMTIDEFIKDILHDFNTPISSIVLNSSLLESDLKNREKISRIQQSTQNILSLQDNLKSYLTGLQTQKESFEVSTLIAKKQKSLQKIYPDIKWELDKTVLNITTNKAAFDRVISNLLSNAAKYNKKDGIIRIKIDAKSKNISIEDTGVGIKDHKKIFKRFYTEGKRGTGIGLHIVQKLCEELEIGIKVTTKIDKGSCFSLNLSKLTIS
jgi:signal transduction histidine kinase